MAGRSSSRKSRKADQSPLETYLREINATPLLTAEEEKQLAYRIQQGDSAARDHMVRANLRLVVNIARSYAARGLSLSDLIAEGNLGLLRAVEAYDPAMNTRFSTYAAYWIRQSMKRAVINMAKTIRIPAYMAQLLSEWRRASARLQEELGRPPTQEEVAAALKLSKKKLNIIKKAIRVYQGMPQSGQREAEIGLDDLLLDERSQTPGQELAHSDELRQVLQLVDQLSEREATVLRLRYGLGGEEPLTLMEIGERLGLTRERVRQIERDALKKLHEQLQGPDA
jgi:RNA polymerase primary sigma factor